MDSGVDQGSWSDDKAVRSAPERFGLRSINGSLWIEGVSLARIAIDVGTPTYVYGMAYVEERVRELQQGLSPRPHLVCYAVKANSSQALLRQLTTWGVGADIVSGGELKRVLAVGMDPHKIVFSGVGKRDDEIDAALAAGLRSINIESLEELERVAARAKTTATVAPVSLRINPDVDSQTHPYLATGLEESKFGVSMTEGVALAERARSLGSIELVGLACHIGSQIVEEQPFLAALARMCLLIGQLAAKDMRIRQLDVGGGLGIAYRPGERPADGRAWAAAIAHATADLEAEIVIEPGRYLVGNAGVLLTRVIGRKETQHKRFVIVDAAMNDLLRPALYDAHHTIVSVEPPPPTPLGSGSVREIVSVDVVGPVCECGDFLAQGRRMPWPESGEVLAVLSAGAYGMTMASNYNTRPLPAEVIVSGDRMFVAKKRVSIDALIAAEHLPEW